VRLQAVRPGSPAEQAGLRADDVIVEFADAPVVNLEEFAALLFGLRAGERVEIVVERGNQRIQTWAVLGQRR
jgi:S1-C subfamily serine protease